MSVDLFDFWDRAAPADHVHPADHDLLSRVGHDFDLRCLPGQLAGHLRTAPLVLLFLSGGLSDQHDLTVAGSAASIEEHRRRRNGILPLWGPDEHPDAWRWWTKLTRVFSDDWQSLQPKVALLNLGAYKSKVVTGRDRKLLERLPSSRVSREWAQDVLFAQGRAGERVVVCLRAQTLWGLSPGRYGQSLFAPNVTRGGHMFGPLRGQVVAAGREILGLSG